jgi:cytochrome c oxidase assembly protein subunit 15
LSASSVETSTVRYRRGLARFATFVAVCVSLLILKGALVTSHDAGLSVPDWPTSYGENMFLFPPSLWIGPIFYEHVHRLIASGVGALTVILAVWIGWVDGRRWVRWLGYAALGAVIVQGVLGGLTVLLQLPTAVSSAHAVLAQTFFIMTVVLAYSQSREWFERRREVAAPEWRRYFSYALLAVALLYVQLLVGAIMRHAGAGLAVPDFPTMGGTWWPSFSAVWIDGINAARSALGLAPVDSFQVAVHIAHRVGGVAVVGGLLSVAYTVRRWSGSSAPARRSAVWIAGIVAVQFLLGVATVVGQREPFITSFHVLGGALTLALTVVLALRLFPVGGQDNP